MVEPVFSSIGSRPKASMTDGSGFVQTYMQTSGSSLRHNYLSHFPLNNYTIILQMALPTGITQRYRHSAVVFGSGPDFRVVVLFGGIDSNFGQHAISETTLLLLCKLII